METIKEDIAHKHFEEAYISLRDKEQRMYSDEEVFELPQVANDHIYKKEWEVRKASAQRLIKYLQKKKQPLKVLEVGCGNGWLSHHLSTIESSVVEGVDVNSIELGQASRVFAGVENLSFIHGDIGSGFLNDQRFDIVVFAAAVQYFQSFRGIINTALNILSKEGEIHILDSKFYTSNEVENARKRSKEYFQKMGFEMMSKFYFHHSFEELEPFNYQILYDADSLTNKLFNKNNPFNWISIKATS
jgi:ubiquinone/menaquinone biosynthesis C-methylase UbiE